MHLKILFNDTRLHVAFTLSLVWLLTVWHARSVNSLIYPLLAIGTVVATDLLITWLRDRKTYFPASSLVSGFLIGLILAPTEPFWVIVLAALFASLSKQLINTGIRQHIFNPAAAGIIAVYFIFQIPVAWWAVSWSKIPLIIIIPLMVKILWRLKRLFLPLSFLTTYFLYLLTQMEPNRAVATIIDGTTFLFAMVMLSEPITSPTTGYFKYIFGILVAIAVILFSKFNFLGDVYLPALLISNLIAFSLIRFRKTLSQTKTAN